MYNTLYIHCIYIVYTLYTRGYRLYIWPSIIVDMYIYSLNIDYKVLAYTHTKHIIDIGIVDSRVIDVSQFYVGSM